MKSSSMHLDVETLERVLHDELEPGREASIGEHLASCMDCARRLAEGRSEERCLFELLSELDHDPPATEPAAILEAARRSTARPWLIAASLALFVAGAGIVYAIPGSPVREWIQGVLGSDPSESPQPVTTQSDHGALSGLAVEPAYPFEIVFTDTQETGRIGVLLTQGQDLEIRVEGAPVGLESRPDRVVISNAGSRSSYEIRVPESAPLVRVRIGSRVVLVKDGEDVRTPAPRDSAGAHIIDMSPPGS